MFRMVHTSRTYKTNELLYSVPVQFIEKQHKQKKRLSCDLESIHKAANERKINRGTLPRLFYMFFPLVKLKILIKPCVVIEKLRI